MTCFYEISNPLILRSSSSQKGSYQEQDSSNREDGQSIFSSQVSNFCCDLKSIFNASSLPQGRVWAGSAAEGPHSHRGATPRRSLRGQSFIDWSSARVLSQSQDHLLWRGQRWAQQQYYYVVYSLSKPSLFQTLTSWMSVCRRGKMPQKGTAQWMGPGRIARACPECWRYYQALHTTVK